LISLLLVCSSFQRSGRDGSLVFFVIAGSQRRPGFCNRRRSASFIAFFMLYIVPVELRLQFSCCVLHAIHCNCRVAVTVQLLDSLLTIAVGGGEDPRGVTSPGPSLIFVAFTPCQQNQFASYEGPSPGLWWFPQEKRLKQKRSTFLVVHRFPWLGSLLTICRSLRSNVPCFGFQDVDLF
jgi:hypothetical protein